MSHDKTKAAARKRVAETGEPCATARREVIRNHQEADVGPGAAMSSGARFFALDYSDMGRVSRWTDTPARRGPGTRGRGARLDHAEGACARLPPGRPS